MLCATPTAPAAAALTEETARHDTSEERPPARRAYRARRGCLPRCPRKMYRRKCSGAKRHCSGPRQNFVLSPVMRQCRAHGVFDEASCSQHRVYGRSPRACRVLCAERSTEADDPSDPVRYPLQIPAMYRQGLGTREDGVPRGLARQHDPMHRAQPAQIRKSMHACATWRGLRRGTYAVNPGEHSSARIPSAPRRRVPRIVILWLARGRLGVRFTP